MTKGKKMEETGARAGRIITLTEASKEWKMPNTAIRKLVHRGKLRPFVGMKEWRFLDTDIFGALERL